MRGGPVQARDCAAGDGVEYAAFLIGDAGAPTLPRGDSDAIVDPVLRGLHDDVAAAVGALGPERVLVLFLGDNVYWDGLPPEGHRDRRHGERVLEAQIAASAPARAVFLLGNHDWHAEGPQGWDRALAQRHFLERFAPRVRMLPPGGCAGPERLDLGPHLRFVLIDPIGFGHLMDHPDEHVRACPERTVRDAYLDLAAEFDAPEGRHLALAVHHPLVTAGPHGGHFGWKQHLFPLTDFWPWAWIPLPVIGSTYPLARQLGVTDTDATSESYGRYIQAIYRATRPLVPLLYVGGHEHSLQVHRDMIGGYYLVSGAGSVRKVDRVVEDMGTVMMATARPGYMRLDVTERGALGLTVLALDAERPEPVYAHCLADGPPQARSGRARPTAASP
ncbi:MAG: hypothetical protein IT293_05685 [Deltaproteobacteria bacterium]|nr:hypothetical protein [Deltaproteobacteria bacterium]